MTDDESRRQFEAVVVGSGEFFIDDTWNATNSDGSYINSLARWMFWAWQASRAATLNEIRAGAIYDFIAHKAIVRIEAVGYPENVLQPAADAVESERSP